MLEKSRNAKLFQWFVCRVSRKVGLLKRRARRKVLSRGIKNCTPLWRKAYFEVKMYKTPHAQSTFWSSDVENLHATVAKSAFWSQNAQNTSWSEHFLKFRCRKIAHRCGEKRILKSKCTKHLMVGALFEVQMSKNCRLLWRKAHYEVKMLKIAGPGTLFEVLTSKKCTPLWRKANFEVKMYKTPHAQHFLKFWCRKIARRCGEKHMWKWKCTKHWRSGSAFWSSDVEKLHAAVARSTCGSENAQNTDGLGALFEVQMSRNYSVSKFVSQSISQLVNESVNESMH